MRTSGAPFEIADTLSPFLDRCAHELVGAVEGATGDPRATLQEMTGVDALAPRVAEQSDFQRIPCTRAGLRVIGQHHGFQRAHRVGGIECAHVHAVLGQSAGLVRGNHGDRAQRLHCAQPAYDGLAPGKPLHAECQCKRQHRRQALGNRCHRQRYREQEDLAEATDAFDYRATDRQD